MSSDEYLFPVRTALFGRKDTDDEEVQDSFQEEPQENRSARM